MSPQVVIEGLDGVGKSTVVRLLAARLDARLDGTPGAGLAAVRAVVDDDWPPEARQLFYAASVCAASARMAAARLAGQPVIYDRYWASTVAYDAAIRRSGVSLPWVEDHLTRPDLTVFLHAPLAVRRARLAERAHLSGEDHRTLEPAVDAALCDAYAEALARPWAGQVVRVEASGGAEAVVTRIVALLDRRARRPQHRLEPRAVHRAIRQPDRPRAA